MVLRKRATLIVKMSQGILLVRHVFPWKWGLPGGGIKRREKAEEAARRELFEETGLRVKKIKHLFDLDYGWHRHNVFLITAKGKINLNWELINYNYLGNVKSETIGKSTQAILKKYLYGKGF